MSIELQLCRKTAKEGQREAYFEFLVRGKSCLLSCSCVGKKPNMPFHRLGSRFGRTSSVPLEKKSNTTKCPLVGHPVQNLVDHDLSNLCSRHFRMVTALATLLNLAIKIITKTRYTLPIVVSRAADSSIFH